MRPRGGSSYITGLLPPYSYWLIPAPIRFVPVGIDCLWSGRSQSGPPAASATSAVTFGSLIAHHTVRITSGPTVCSCPARGD